jgi:hypothetical protein
MLKYVVHIVTNVLRNVNELINDILNNCDLPISFETHSNLWESYFIISADLKTLSHSIKTVENRRTKFVFFEKNNLCVLHAPFFPTILFDHNIV